MIGFLIRKALGVEAKSLDANSFPTDLLAPSVLSGVSVTPQTTLSVPAVANAVSLISGAIGTLPLWIYRDEGQGKAVAEDHPAFDLVAYEANDWTSSSSLRTQLATDALLHGDGFAAVNRIGDGKAFEFIRLMPGSVTVLYEPATGEPVYRHQSQNIATLDTTAQVRPASNADTPRDYHWSDIIHVRAPLSVNGLTGVAPIAHAREAIGLAIVLEAYAARLFGNGARPSGVLSFEQKLDAAAAARIRDSWNAAHAGSASGKTAVLEQGGKFQPLALTSVDAQFLEQRQLQTVEIARAFNISPALIGDLSRATWSNLESSNRQFLQLTLLPWLRNFESAYRRVLLSPEERRTYSVEFDTSDLLRGDTAARGEFLAKMRSNGIFTANECRAVESLPAHEAGDSLESPHVQTAKATLPAKEAA
ncbi:phage portal protein [Methylocystis sp. S23]